MEIQISMEGGKSESLLLKNFKNKLPRNMEEGLARVGKLLEGAMKRRIRGSNAHLVGRSPYADLRNRTGFLRQSIATDPPSGAQKVAGGLQVRIGPHVIYGRIHEFGGWTGRNHATYIPKRPYVFPTLVDNRKKVINVMSKTIFEPIK